MLQYDSHHTLAWQSELSKAYRDPVALLRALELPVDAWSRQDQAPTDFPMRVPRGFVARMRKGDPHDPLLRQVLPSHQEHIDDLYGTRDPVGDLAALRRPHLLEKYHGRVLLLTTMACAVHCRYCFRRHLRSTAWNPEIDPFQHAIAYIQSHPSIREVILSGGDPLCLPDHKLAALTDRLREIKHIRRLRIHTRLPVLLPQRVSDGLLRWLAGQPWQTVLVLHVNHANEIDSPVAVALQRLQAQRVTLLNQSVLLTGVNDSASALAQLSEALFAAGVLPYYLHLLDRVQGASHFEVSEARAQSLLDRVRRELPGYLVPRLVRESAGLPYKLPIC